MLTLGKLALLAEVAVPQYVERVGVVGPVDDPEILTTADLDPRLDAALGEVGLPLFAPEESLVVLNPLGSELREMRSRFLSQLAVERFLGYMQSQHERMLGQSNRNVPNRPELIERHGWDVKYGSHALRLAYQGFEIASTGTLTLPLAPTQRERVLAVKRGEVPREEVSAEISKLESQVRELLERGRTPLPETADVDRISAWAVDAQRRHWGWV